MVQPKVHKIHKIDLRLRVNAGMDFPTCCANEKLLDCDKSRWALTNNKDEVTCKHCLRKMRKGPFV
jgi:hypothetical protein